MTKLTMEQIEKDFLEYKENKRELVDKDLPIKNKSFRKVTRPIQRAALFAQRKIKGQSVEVLGNKDYEIPDGKSVTFVVSHIGKFDYEIVNELIKEQFYVMASDYRNMHGNMNQTMMEWFGVWYVDELDKVDRYYTGEVNKKTLRDGCNTMILPEGTWNISENEIIYDTHFGAVDGAISVGSLILPISVEQYDNDFVVNFGELFDPSKISDELSFSLGCYKKYNDLDETDKLENELKLLIKTVTNTMLRDSLATLKYEIWEKAGVESRRDIPFDFWEKFILKRISEWPGYSMDEQIDSVVHTKEKELHVAVLNELINLSLIHPGILSAKDLEYYLSAKQREILINESLIRLREKMLQENLPIEQRLEKFKQLKRK